MHALTKQSLWKRAGCRFKIIIPCWYLVTRVQLNLKQERKAMKCPICGKIKPDVMERPDHYAQEIGGREGATMICCADCEHENAMDI